MPKDVSRISVVMNDTTLTCNDTDLLLDNASLPLQSIPSSPYPSSPSPGSCIPTFSQEDIIEFPEYIRTTATVFCGVILTLGVTGNVLVPVVVCRTKELRNSTNLFLVNLSVADLLVLIVCMPSVLIELHSQPEVWLLGEFMCKTVPLVELTVAHGSILTILAISFERFYAICRPLKADYTCTKMRALAIIIVVWIVAIVTTCPILSITEYSLVQYHDGKEVPVCITSAQTLWQQLFVMVTMAIFFWLPLVILVILYGIITRDLMKDRRTLNSSTEKSQMRARRQVVLMLSAVVVCFFVCLAPFRILTMWVVFVPEEWVKGLGLELYYNLLYFCRLLLYINSAVNPILYNVISSKFRHGFLRLLLKQPKGRLIRQGTINTLSSSTCYHNISKSNRRFNESLSV